MKTLKKILIALIIGLMPIEIFAWNGMPVPALHVDGRYIKDPTGKAVLLHGWHEPCWSGFNGGSYNDAKDYTSPSSVASELNFHLSMADILSDTNPRYGYNHGWYCNMVRFVTDNGPGSGLTPGWGPNGGSLVDANQFNGWMNNMVVPFAQHCATRGLYVILLGTPSSAYGSEGSHNMTQKYQQNLITYWTAIASNPSIKNASNILFEICNEPVNIETSFGANDWGSGNAAHWQAIHNFMQPIVDAIRNAGANNIVLVPSLGYQSDDAGWPSYPINGSNIAYASHLYPGWFNGNADDPTPLLNSSFKPCSAKFPLVITEMNWGWDSGAGITSKFGKIMKNWVDVQGNVSYVLGMLGDNLGSLEKGFNNTTLSNMPSGHAAFEWWPTYALSAPDDGTPTFTYASVTDNNPKQIQVTLSKSIVDSIYFDGFTVKVDNQVVTIDRVVFGNTNQLIINLNNSILKENEIQLSYSNGNVVSIYNKNLVAFNDTLVDNLLNGASPRIVELKTTKDGNTLMAKFNVKMQLPSDISALALKAEYNGNISIPIRTSAFYNNDSTYLLFPLSNKVYADYKLLLSYSGDNISSSKSSLLKTFSDFPVTNYSIGLPVQIDTGKIETDGINGILEFSKLMPSTIEQFAFILKINKIRVSFKGFYSFYNTIKFTLPNTVHYGDTVTLSYTPGNETAADLGKLKGFSNFPISNPVKEPLWISIPGKIEAEKYYSQSGIQTENTGDVGGGLDVGWIDKGDWLEYGITNNTSDSNYEISFRVASPSGDGKFEYYLDNKKISEVSVPKTGGYQTWKSVVDTISIGQGNHYLKIVATNSGFNINYCNIKKVVSGIENLHEDIINIYPNPVSKEMNIGSTDFKYKKVEIIDIMGKTVLSRLTAHESELHIPVNLPNGMYLVKISNEKQFRLKRIIIDNN